MTFLSRAYPSGSLARFFANLLNSWLLPRSPGLMKSNKDQRSDSLFSTGVPVITIRLTDFSFLTDLVCFVPGFLIAWASSRITYFQSYAWSHPYFCTIE